MGDKSIGLWLLYTFGPNHACCFKSLVSMGPLWTMILARLPGGVLNQTKLAKVCVVLGTKRPAVVKTQKSVTEWAELMAERLRVALGHVRAVH